MLIYIKELQDYIKTQVDDQLNPIKNDYMSKSKGGTVSAGVTFSSTTTVGGAFTANGTTTIKGTSTFGGTATFNGGITTANLTSNGSITGKSAVELYYSTPFIDFHFGNSSADYTARIIEEASGTLSVKNHLKTGAGTFSGAVSTSGTLSVSGASALAGAVTCKNTLNVTGAATLSGGVTGAGNISGFSKVYNAVWNDYAEFFERGSTTEAGDIVAIDINADRECYVLADRNLHPNMIVGVHSDTYGHLIGGDQAPSGVDYVDHNIDKFIPVGLSGRVNVKCLGCVKRGDVIVLSHIPGVGRAWQSHEDDPFKVGIACQDKAFNDVERIRIFIKY